MANEVEVKDLPKEDELKDKDLDKVSGGCMGMGQDPKGGISSVKITNTNPADINANIGSINTTKIVR